MSLVCVALDLASRRKQRAMVLAVLERAREAAEGGGGREERSAKKEDVRRSYLALPPGCRLSEQAGNSTMAAIRKAMYITIGEMINVCRWDLDCCNGDLDMNNSRNLQHGDKEHTASSSGTKSGSNNSDCSSQPQQPFSQIFARLPTAADCVTFILVCKSWGSDIDYSSPIPWLVGRQNDQASEIPLYDFFSVFRRSLVYIKGGAACRTGIMCRTSSRGWIVQMKLSPTGTFLILWNPVTNRRIQLPPVIAPPYCSDAAMYAVINKVILSADPAACDNWVALATFTLTADLCFCRRGDHGWTFFGFAHHYQDSDVEFYNGRFYIMKKHQIFRCELGPVPQVICIQSADPSLDEEIDRSGIHNAAKTFVVERSGELLFISIWSDVAKIYKVKLEDNGVTFLELQDLDDYALFLGRNHSFALDVKSFPRCTRNCIYLAEERELRSTIAKVVYLKDQRCETIPYAVHNPHTSPQPWLWLLPSERISKHFEMNIPAV